MSSLSRRRLGFALCGALVGACQRVPTRETVLARLVEGVVGADLAELELRSRDLGRAGRRLVLAPSPAELTALRAAWRRAATAWKRASAFRLGPLQASQALTRAAYWPTRSAAVDALLQSRSDFSAAHVAELGADLKGLYALEYLIFDGEAAAGAWQRISPDAAAPTRQLIALYAEDISAHAERARAALSAGYVASFVHGGQDSVSQLVAQIAESVENLLAARINLVLWLESMKRLRPLDVEGGRSGTSLELSLALLQGSYRLYGGAHGDGLSRLVEAAAPHVAAHVAQAFVTAIGELRNLAAPIEAVAVTERTRVEASLRAIKALEVTLKNELPSALGATLTFTALDAD
ncbi:MAG: imelysin family protein [Polyangiaceae bacterium]